MGIFEDDMAADASGMFEEAVDAGGRRKRPFNRF